MKIYLELSQADTNKFWEIQIIENTFTIRYGKVGNAGRKQIKEFETSEIALKEATKLIEKKRKAGYQDYKPKSDCRITKPVTMDN